MTANTSGELQPLQPGEQIELVLEFPGSKEAVTFSGKLRNVTQTGSRLSMGIEFAESDSGSIQTADNYIKAMKDLL